MPDPVTSVLVVLREALDLLTDYEESDGCAIDLPVCRSGIYLGGEVPWDTCSESCSKGENGMLWAKLVSINPVNSGNDSTNCPTFSWTAEFGIVRCIATMSNDGAPPPMDMIEADADQQVADADAIFNALRCCDARSEALQDVTVNAWNPLGPNGACAGGAWTVRGVLSVCC